LHNTAFIPEDVILVLKMKNTLVSDRHRDRELEKKG